MAWQQFAPNTFFKSKALPLDFFTLFYNEPWTKLQFEVKLLFPRFHVWTRVICLIHDKSWGSTFAILALVKCFVTGGDVEKCGRSCLDCFVFQVMCVPFFPSLSFAFPMNLHQQQGQSQMHSLTVRGSVVAGFHGRTWFMVWSRQSGLEVSFL